MINKRFKNRKKTDGAPLETEQQMMGNRPSGIPAPGSSAVADTDSHAVADTDSSAVADSHAVVEVETVLDAESPTIPAPGAYTMPASKWFFTFMCMNIPVIGWLYLLSKAFGKKENQLRDFAKAYLLYKLVFLVISLVLLGILIYVGLDIADKLLAYMEML